MTENPYVVSKCTLSWFTLSDLAELTPERVFNLHPKIRWAGLATEQGEVIFVEMRPGVKSLSPVDTDQSFVQLGPLLLTGVCERLVPWAGSLETVISRYEKVVMIVTRIRGRKYLAMTIAREDFGFLTELLEKLSELAA